MPHPARPAGETAPTDLPSHLHSLLRDLSNNPYPHVENPACLKKRASVALILRIQPRFAHWPDEDAFDAGAGAGAGASTEDRLNAFFAQSWVQNGDAEVLFIKRAHRPGDRWTAHVALPGGRRDPEDADDRAAAVRETWEEVGIKLEEEGERPNCIAVGNLPERVVTTSWGKVPLMVLCPYIYILTSPQPPALRLQPTEVGSTHWVSLRALLSPHQRTFWHEDVSNRLAKQEIGIKRTFLRLMLGKMIFAAVRLIPSSSTYASTIPSFVPEQHEPAPPAASSWAALAQWVGGMRKEPGSPTDTPLLLWGLTLGIMADFLDLLPPHTSLKLWTYPTFTPWDVQFTLWALSYSFRKRKAREVLEHSEGPVLVEEGLDAVAPSKGELEAPPAGISGLGVERYYSRLGQKQRATRSSAVGIMLEGYYDIVRRTVAVVVAGRISIVGLMVVYLWMRSKKRTHSVVA